MAISKRDRSILYWIGGLLVVTALYIVGIEPVLQSYLQLEEELQIQRETLEKNQTTLADAKAIEEGYKMVEAQFPKDDPDRDPSEVFNEEVVDLVVDVVGRQPEGYNTPSTNPIKGATGYEFLILPVVVKGNVESIAKLFKAFNQKGYLIQSASINSELDKDEVTANISLGRIVKIQAEEDKPALGRPGQFSLGGR